MNKNINTKRLGKITLVITLLLFTWIISEMLLRGGNVIRTEYGIDPSMFIKVLIGAEVFFDFGIVLILLGSGVFKLRLKHILSLDFQNVKFDNELVYAGFTVNRIAATIPPLYLLVAGWGKLPFYVVGLAFTELFIVLVIASIPFEFKKFFEIFWSKK
jgi:hypothetical protein